MKRLCTLSRALMGYLRQGDHAGEEYSRMGADVNFISPYEVLNIAR